MNAKTFEFYESGTGVLIFLGFFQNITDHRAGANATYLLIRPSKGVPSAKRTTKSGIGICQLN